METIRPAAAHGAQLGLHHPRSRPVFGRGGPEGSLTAYLPATMLDPADAVHSQVLLDEKSSDIRKLLVRLFDVVIKFCNIQNRLYDVVLSEAERLARRKELRQERLEKVY